MHNQNLGLTLGFFMSVLLLSPLANATDKYLWLEDIHSDKSMQWVKQTNAKTDKALTQDPLYHELYQQALKVLNNNSRLPVIEQRGKWLYNFWQDEKHPRGIYRRTTLKQFKKKNTKWQTMLDMDNYSQKHGKNYDFHGINCLSAKAKHCLVMLSPGGSDAVVVREYNLAKKKFIKQGFTVDLAKTRIAWIDKNHVYIASDFGKDSMTDSGYPRIIKIWQRGEQLAQAQTIFKGSKQSVSVNAYRMTTKNKEKIDIINENTSFWENKSYQLKAGKLTPLNIPSSANVAGNYHDKFVISLKKDWNIADKKFVQGEIILADLEFLSTGKGVIESVIKPTNKAIVENILVSKNGLFITVLEDVKSRLYRYQQKKDHSWQIKAVKFPDNGSIKIVSLDDKSGNLFATYESFITPPTLYLASTKSLKNKRIKQQVATFDGSKMQVKQFFATSKDGTKVPYFVVMLKHTSFNGTNPTHIFSYGGFRNSLLPSYSGSYEALSGAYGKLWLERGGVFVLANIRGGGEYGPAWHQAALHENRPKAYEDFEAVARDLFAKKITSAQHLGIEGRSNGGLLVTATMTRHPELYNAVVCGAPLIDMKRYNKLLAGASWMGEYGNPDIPAQWDYIKTYSPYQKLEQNRKYPAIFFYTSTQDDRVHPGHARKMAAKMLEYGNEVYYFENTEGGHHGFSTNEQLAHRLALSYTHLWRHLKPKG